VNLFQAEQLNALIKQKKLEEGGEVEGKEDYLRKTDNLGNIFRER
jgi:hypothetical protein